jgi:hypothetical protein
VQRLGERVVGLRRRVFGIDAGGQQAVVAQQPREPAPRLRAPGQLAARIAGGDAVALGDVPALPPAAQASCDLMFRR